jgi:hypothetical protein
MMTIKDIVEKKTDKRVEVLYEGSYRILNKHATPIARDEKGFYAPKDAEEIEALEYQVKMGRVIKQEI